MAPPQDSAARTAGWLLLATAAATVLAVIGRVGATELAPLHQSLAAISANPGLYGFGGAARLVSGCTLYMAAWSLLRTWIMRRRLGSRPVPVLLAISGAATALSGACAVALAATAPQLDLTGELDYVRPPTVVLLHATWITGRIGFSLAGLALIAAAHRQWRAGGFLQPIAPVSALIGAGMQLIWFGAAVAAHYITGPAFVVWLAGIGILLVTGRVEQRFAAQAEEGS